MIKHFSAINTALYQAIIIHILLQHTGLRTFKIQIAQQPPNPPMTN